MMITPETPIIWHAPGDDAVRDQAWMLFYKKNATLNPTFFDYVMGLYAASCRSYHVNPYIAIAQMSLETGYLTTWWSTAPRRNPAGIGVTGQTTTVKPDRGSWSKRGDIWEEGVVFPSWVDSVNAHVGRLFAYATPIELHGQVARPLTDALAWRPLPPKLIGTVKVLSQLTGTWAVDPQYHVKIIDRANAMFK